MANRGRTTEPTARDASGELLLSTLTPPNEDDDALEEWGCDAIADGTPPHEPAQVATLARGSAPTATSSREAAVTAPSRPRTNTHHDPLTTAVLAQIARDDAVDDPDPHQ